MQEDAVSDRIADMFLLCHTAFEQRLDQCVITIPKSIGIT